MLQSEVVESRPGRLSEILDPMSQVLVKLQKKGTMVLPRRLREMAGLTEGTLMKVDVLEGPRFLVTPQVAIDRDLVTSKPKNRKEAFRELAQVVAELRQEAKEKGINKMTKQEINAAVAAMRRDLKKTSKRSAK
jgi:bifunctional DNA-binding transcriptional regulator/antitoxin component of YhaV-PrlF toxin-antitoxin module